MSFQLPIESYGIPKNSEWGPLLWRMLHGAAEKLTRSSNPIIFQDQRREMIFVLRDVENVMPCQLCRNHYKEWRTKNPIDRFPNQAEEFREAVRSWLFLLHEEINYSHGASSGISMDDLGPLYSGYDLKEMAKQFATLMNRAVSLKAIDRDLLKRFNTHFTFLARIL